MKTLLEGINQTRLSRRTALKTMGAAAATLAMPGLTRASGGKIKVGFISPLTGPLSPFGESDGYTVEIIKTLLANGIQNNGKTYEVDILVRDAQSDPNKSAELAGELILNENVQLLIPASTTDVINSAADQAELNGVPSISSAAPWQAFVMPRGGDKKPFDWTYHFFWGLEDALATFVGLWQSLETNRNVGMLFPRNADGETWGNRGYGLPPAVEKAGFKTIVPSMFQPRTNDFSAQISQYKSGGCDIVGGITYVSDLKTFITQCSQQKFNPKVVTVAAALLFPSGVEAMGPLGNGMSSEVWWTPAFPFKSSLTGEVSRDVANAWESKMKKQWIQPLGYAHALWEVAIDTLKRAKDPMDRTSVRDALKATDLNTLVGPIKFGAGPHANICKTPIFGGQWVKSDRWMYDLKIVDNSVSKLIEPEAKLQPIKWS
ncbi:ABC transporter substrate-binding protein [Agrobacterium tumefaciens]|uniref:ABC transporter substrate-binding protein n=1 Tax=Agrobacterium tumefaciens TaxID=358 RepID=UPI00384A97FD